jgi:hypothetical protein
MKTNLKIFQNRSLKTIGSVLVVCLAFSMNASCKRKSTVGKSSLRDGPMSRKAPFGVFLSVQGNHWHLTPVKRSTNGSPDNGYQVTDFSIALSRPAVLGDSSETPGSAKLKVRDSTSGSPTYIIKFTVKKTTNSVTANCEVRSQIRSTFDMEYAPIMCDGDFSGTSTGDDGGSVEKDDEVIGSGIADRGVRIDTTVQTLFEDGYTFAPETRGKWHRLHEWVLEQINTAGNDENRLVDMIVTKIQALGIAAKDPYKLAYGLIKAYSVGPPGPSCVCTVSVCTARECSVPAEETIPGITDPGECSRKNSDSSAQFDDGQEYKVFNNCSMR